MKWLSKAKLVLTYNGIADVKAKYMKKQSNG